jgi:hypothetical protein
VSFFAAEKEEPAAEEKEEEADSSSRTASPSIRVASHTNPSILKTLWKS